MKHVLLAGVAIIATPIYAQSVLAPRTVAVTETVHGITLTDEYRWMEDAANAAEMSSWVKAEAGRTRAALAALPGREAFAKEIKESSSSLTRIRDVQMAGGTTAFRRAQAGDKVAKLVIVQGGKERVLIDPNTAGGASVTAINNMSLSPDGRLIAVHQAKGGGEVGEITVYAVASGQPVGQRIQGIWGEFALTWLDGEVIAYTQMADPALGGDPVEKMRLFISSIDGSMAPVPVLGFGTPGSDFAAEEFPVLAKPAASRWVAGWAGGARADQRLFVAARDAVVSGSPNWINVAALDDRVQGFDLLNDDAFVLTSRSNSAGQLLKRRVSSRGLGEPRVVFEGNDRLILTGVVAAKDGVYVSAQSDGVTKMFFSSKGTAPFAEIALPFEGGDVIEFRPLIDGSGVSFAYSGWLQNFRHFTAVNGKVKDAGYASSTWDGAKDFVAERMEARSADGTSVPLVVLRTKGALPSGGMPTILEAYGGYGVSTTTPFYGRDYMAWVARGGAMAFCGVRGGGERGRAWHEGGRGLNKPKGHEDFQACAEALRSKGISPAKGPVGTGSSMGGTLSPPAVIKRPDLFAGLIPRVGVLNASRIGNAPNGANQFDEMGDPSKPEEYRGLVAMDAYQLLATASSLPPTLVTIGLNDNRVAPWMSAKFAARAQAKFGRDRVMLRADDDAGHGIGTAEDARVAETADVYAFAWNASKAQ